MYLLSDRNTKLMKGEKFGYKTFGLTMSPAERNTSGKSVCPFASDQCRKFCLNFTGNGGYSSVQKKRIERTDLFFSNRTKFLEILHSEISNLKLMYRNLAIRLNVLSDLSYESFKIKSTGLNIFESHPDVQFYDYTKNPNRNFNIPNYHLTFSRSETNETDCIKLAAQGVNVAVVFHEVPATFNGLQVVDGDKHDLRFLDGKNVIVGLRAKGIIRNQNKMSFMVGNKLN